MLAINGIQASAAMHRRQRKSDTMSGTSFTTQFDNRLIAELIQKTKPGSLQFTIAVKPDDKQNTVFDKNSSLSKRASSAIHYKNNGNGSLLPKYNRNSTSGSGSPASISSKSERKLQRNRAAEAKPATVPSEPTANTYKVQLSHLSLHESCPLLKEYGAVQSQTEADKCLTPSTSVDDSFPVSEEEFKGLDHDSLDLSDVEDLLGYVVSPTAPTPLLPKVPFKSLLFSCESPSRLPRLSRESTQDSLRMSRRFGESLSTPPSSPSSRSSFVMMPNTMSRNNGFDQLDSPFSRALSHAENFTSISHILLPDAFASPPLSTISNIKRQPMASCSKQPENTSPKIESLETKLARHSEGISGRNVAGSQNSAISLSSIADSVSKEKKAHGKDRIRLHHSVLESEVKWMQTFYMAKCEKDFVQIARNLFSNMHNFLELYECDL